MSAHKHAADAALGSMWPHGLRISEIVAPSSQTQTHPLKPSLQERGHSIRTSFVAAWKWLEGRRRLQLSSRRLHITESLSLGEKRNLLIVTVDGAQLLIGTSAAGVQLLTKLDSTSPQVAEQEREWAS